MSDIAIIRNLGLICNYIGRMIHRRQYFDCLDTWGQRSRMMDHTTIGGVRILCLGG
jgi:hypothetical protein